MEETRLTPLPLVQHALTTFYGISRQTSAKLCARLQLHGDLRVSQLSDAQITALSAYLSSPGSIPALKPSKTSPYPGQKAEAPAAHPDKIPPSQRVSASEDPLRAIVLESDLRRQLRANIAHHRDIGTYRGRRHVQGLPVRGQRTQSNANTASKLNRVERRGMATSSRHSSVSDMVSPLLSKRFV